MSFNVNIKINDVETYDCFFSEQHKSKRSSLDIIKNNESITLNISAKDAVALRAELNSLAKLILVYEKMSRIIEEQK